MNVKRITRLLSLLQVLHSGTRQNSVGIAKACGISRRTVFRDIEALRAAGLPLRYDSEYDHYSIPNSYCLPPTNLTPAESLSLIAMAIELGRSDRLPFYEPARAAALKLANGLPHPVKEKLRMLRQAIHISPTPVGVLDAKATIYQELVDARTAGKVVQLEYDAGPHQGTISTNFRTYSLLFRRHSWYVIGRSSLDGAIRTFNLSRIVSIECLEKKFSVPRDFNIARYLRNAWVLNPEPGPDFAITVKFTPMVARSVADVKWHKTQQLEFDNDGSLIFHAQVSGLNEIIWWILAYGDQAEVLQPERLRQLVAQRARNMVARYEAEHEEMVEIPKDLRMA